MDITPGGTDASGNNNVELTPEETTLVPGSESFGMLTEEERVMIEGESTEVKTLHSGQGPLDNPVIHRGYTDRKFAGDTASPILEPIEARQVINQPPADKVNVPNAADVNKKVAEDQYKDRMYAGDTLGEKPISRTGGNPAVQTMTTKERKDNLDMTVNSALEAYTKGKEWLGGWLTISDSKLIKRQNAGKTPPDWAVLYDSGTKEVMTLRQYVTYGNKMIVEACKTDEAFKQKVRPILMAELDRRNWIISPQQNGLIMFGTDLASMGQKLLMIHMRMNKIISQADKEFELFQAGGYLSARQVYNMQLNQMPPPPPPPTPPINYGQPISRPPQQQQTVTPPPVVNDQSHLHYTDPVTEVKNGPVVAGPEEKHGVDVIELPKEEVSEEIITFTPPED